MKLSNLSQFETLNNETVETINGGAAGRDSRRNDSTSHDCKKNDEFQSVAAGQA
ncbi:ComC/BlpC family leader-containing pheromone/bacteriocin [Tenacibaculum sp. 190524A02b]|uniref:ComC/BlpC family leader-containing pheromone/bacteriocin n=1 Tax=Tenacibaculum vairaonense TaxID=3137860 RepID=UPI0032B27AC5